jgi:formate dehydrogenase beta subunit
MTDKRYQVVVPDTEYYRNMVKCQAACPVHTDARAYITAIARGDLEEGYRTAHDPNPLSSICGRICGAPCEVACRRGAVGPDFEPVAIRPLKRVLTENYGPEASQRLPGSRVSRPLLPSVEPGSILPGQGVESLYSPVRWSRENLSALATASGRRRGKVAIIGAGPAGLAAARDLAILGHQVTIYEAGPKTGGMVRYGVPVYRINQQVMNAEIQSILDLGVELRLNMPVGKEVTLADLRHNHDAVFLGIGLMQGRKLNMEGVDLDGVITAVDLMLNYNLGYKVKLGKRVIVVGGGDVAMDAARTALRVGQATDEQQAALSETTARAEEEAEAVHTALDVARTALRVGVVDLKVIALESWDELPASKLEIEETLEEGIRIFPRYGPNRVVGQDGQVAGLEIIEVASVFDQDGRFNPQFKAGTEQVWECDSIILAIGQAPDLNVLGGADDVRVSPRGLIEIDPATGQTSAPDVFAGGDVAYGPRLLIHAVRDGHLAALGIEQHIQGRPLASNVTATWTELPTHTPYPDWMELARSKVPTLPVDRRTGVTVVELGYPIEEAYVQGQRCLECSVNTIFDGTKCILCNGCVDVCPWNCLKIVRLDQLSGDETLAQIVETCSGGSSEAERDKPSMAAMIKDDTACTRCALCAKRCPTRAITMEAFRFKEELEYQ